MSLSGDTQNQSPAAAPPVPPPPPPPPPMPNFDLKGQQRARQAEHQEGDLGDELGVDLLSPNGHIKPHMKMRTLNWRRIPKRRVLSQQLVKLNSELADRHDDSTSQMLTEMKISNTPKRMSSELDQGDQGKASSDSDEETNIWFKIAKSNKTIRRFGQPQEASSQQYQQQTDTSQETITNSDNKSKKSLGSRPVSGVSSKSASRIREMLESVRRRMAAVTAAHSSPPPAATPPTSAATSTTPNDLVLLPDVQTPVNGPTLLGLDSSSLFLTGASGGGGDVSAWNRRTPLARFRPRNVIEAIDFNDLENLFCLQNQPLPFKDDDHEHNSPTSFLRRASWRTNASSDSVISSNNSYDSHLMDSQHFADNAHHSLGSSLTYHDPECCNNDERCQQQTDETAATDDSLEFLSENILDSKKSLNVNIFLKQLKPSNQGELFRLINEGNHKQLGEQRLQTILKLLPDEQEQVQLIKFYARNKQHRLPVAEKFLLQLLIRVPNLALKIKFMLVQEKYYEDIHEQIPQELDKIESAVREIRKSRKFRDLLNLVLVTGNFLNSGGYAADAVGFSLDCLDRLQEVRSNREGVYLIHYVAEVANKMELIDFQSELAHVESASRVCMESLKLDLVSMQERIQELKGDVEQKAHPEDNDRAPPTGPNSKPPVATRQQVKDQEFPRELLQTLEGIKCNTDFMKKRLTVGLECIRRRLADYLCEDVASFDLHNCFCSILAFSQRLKVAADENDRRQRLEVARTKSNTKISLKRSNTINPRLPPQLARQKDRLSQRQSLANSSLIQEASTSFEPSPPPAQPPAQGDRGRASFGGYLTSERRQSFMSSKHSPAQHATRAMAPSNLVRTSSTCSSMVKSSLSSLSSQATTSGNSSATNTSGDCDDLHDGLMRLLNESNSHRSSDMGAKVRPSHGGAQHHRRASGRLAGQ